MAGPWEQYGSTPAAAPPDGPWTQYADAPKERYQTWPERLARGLASSVQSAVTLPGDVYSGKTQVDPSNPEFIGRTVDFATVGTPMAPKAATSLTSSKAALPNADELLASSNSLYSEARAAPLALKADSIRQLAGTIQSGLEEKGILGEFAPDTFTVLKKLQSPADGAHATGSNIISAREALRNASQNFTNPREAKAANQAIAQLDEFIKAPPAESVLAGNPATFAETAKAARGDYAAAQRSNQILGESEIAQGNAAAANSGQNIGNATRQRFNAILKSDKQSSGYSAAEITQMERIRDGTLLGNATRFAGNLLGGGGGLGSVASAAVGAGTLGPIGAAAPAVGYALKKFSDASVNRQVRKLDEMTRARSPLAESSASTALTPAEHFKREALLRAFLAAEARKDRR